MSYLQGAILLMLMLSLCSCGLVAPGKPVASAGPTAAGLKCEYLVDPAGIDVITPRLSWIMDSSEQGQRQTAYEVLVASSPDLLASDHGDMWDSGIVESDQSINVEFAGAALTSGEGCFWKVRLWDKDHQPTAWSAPATWSMGLLNADDWKSRWIELTPSIADEDFTVANLDGTPWIWGGEGNGAPAETLRFRREISLPSTPMKSAGIVLYGDDSFTLFVNGRKASHVEQSDRPTAVDLMQFLTPGANLIAIEVHNKGAKSENSGLAAKIAVSFNDGQTAVVTADTTWKYSTDKKTQDWNQLSFDDSGWASARLNGQVLASDQHRQWLWHPASSPANYLRREFTADAPIRRATAYVSGLGWFELHINGSKVGDHVLDPVVSDYTKRAYYATFDVTPLVKQGVNAVGVVLGLGRYSAMRVRLQIDVEYADGGSALWVTDPSWKATDNGPIVMQSEYDGETYDFAREMPGWDEPGFDDSAWTAASVSRMPDLTMSAQMVEPIRVTGVLHPIAMMEPRPNVYVFDMGQNMVGWCQVRVSGPAGTDVRLRHAETRQPDGMIYTANLRTAKATDQYLLNGGGEKLCQPHFTYHGFRFVEVTGYPGVPTLDDLEGHVVNDDLDTSAVFECSNELLNQIHHNIYWGVRGNYNGVPTDCPQRNERLGWLGDRGEECAGEAYLFDIAALYQKWVRDMRDSQTSAGSIADTAPPGTMHNDGVVWPSTYPLAVDMLLHQYGNIRCVAEQYDGMKLWIEYMNRFQVDGIMPRNTYGDWCVPPESPELVHSRDPLRQTDGKLLSTAYFYHDLELMAAAAKLLGKDADAVQFASEAETIRQAFNRRFLNVKTGQYGNGSQTGSVLPLAFGMVPEPSRQHVFNALVQKIQEQNKDHLGTGLVGAQWLMRVLSDNGRPDLAYAIATQSDYPSWGYMVSKGATTIWELWNGDTADPSMNSGNHVMLIGDLNIWLHEYVLGIAPDPTSPGWKHVLIRPRLTAQLDWARGHYDSPYGRIACDWSRHDSAFLLNVTIPPNSTATVYVPVGDASSVIAPPDTRLVRIGNGQAVYEVPSGSYSFSSRLETSVAGSL
ncbi:MAG TPA: family 78 glycoside hydrolase catalytic domain [Tepidisphaeraceae bacterium]|nr:family 78 glycoside hydrolase catalytic domain [Tepidisphaeraceae bacterium]